MLKTKVENWICESLGIKEVEIQENTIKGSASFGDYAIAPREIIRIEEKVNQGLDEIVNVLKSNLQEELIDTVGAAKVATGGFINLFLSKQALFLEMKEASQDLEKYLDEIDGKKTIVFDYSAPNIAKPFSVGHLRSTVIGQANYNIHKSLGYKVIGINHIGDWGTQFGKLIYAVKTWGDEEKIEGNPIPELAALYQKFHRESETDPSINKKAAEWFRKLELKDTEATAIWKKCIDWSFAEFDRLYKILGIKIDKNIGESFFADKTDEVIAELKEKGLLKDSEGAKIVELKNMPPAIIQKTNESTLYLTRDLAVVKYRIQEYKPDEIIYHVGADQTLHFKQLFAIVDLLGWAKKIQLIHASHGLMRLPEGKMSTRHGRTVLLDDLISEAVDRVQELESERETSAIKGRETELAISAIKYADLSTNRQSDVIFSFDRLIDLKGNSAIYLEYTYARMNGLMAEFEKKYGQSEIDRFSDATMELVRLAVKYKDTLLRSAKSSSPNVVCDFAYHLANQFNSFYEKNRVITKNKDESANNIFAVRFVMQVLGSCLGNLGLSKFEKI